MVVLFSDCLAVSCAVSLAAQTYSRLLESKFPGLQCSLLMAERVFGLQPKSVGLLMRTLDIGINIYGMGGGEAAEVRAQITLAVS